MQSIMGLLHQDFVILSNCFYKSSKALSPDKYFIMVFGKKDELRTNVLCDNIRKSTKKNYF